MSHFWQEVSDKLARTNCERCGFTYVFHRRYFTRTMEWWLCASCKAQPMQICRYGDDWCKPWQGDFDIDLLVCLDERGKPVMLGLRSCGHWDCVRPEHLVSRAVTQPVA